MTALFAIAGLTLSFAVALLLEELLLGGMFHALSGHAIAPAKACERKEDTYAAD